MTIQKRKGSSLSIKALGRKGEGHLGKKACKHLVMGLDDKLK